ncbi:MAG TPA: ankyrin repeat domain-containing protein [Pyrinomonadaceae bacterium]|nr:ankyrin repeat domain-containing protein [Pyrinomonadaceae bacterium]
MSKNNLLEQIEVKNPCSQDWDEMKGNDEVRFCGHCNLNVNNLSAMTRRKALKIVRRSQGRICVRYVQNPVDKTPVFADRLYQITRRAGIAAGVLGASLSLSTLTYAQGETVLIRRAAEPKTEVSQTDSPEKKDKTKSVLASISGTVRDADRAFAPNVIVTLFNLKTNESRMANSDAEGFYEFRDLAPGIYKLVTAGEKGNAEVSHIEIIESSDNRQDLLLMPLILAEVTVAAPEELNIVSGGAMFDISYNNPLSKAVINADAEEVRNLIYKGEDVNGKEKDSNAKTPLFLAIENGNVEIAEILLSFGAKVNARDKSKQTPLMQLFDDTPAELARLLIRYGAKINVTDEDGNTPLILAAEDASAEILQILIDYGADVNAKNKEGQTALLRAAFEDNLEKVKVLVLAGADVNAKDKDGKSALDLTDDEEIKEFLVSRGAVVEEDN